MKNKFKITGAFLIIIMIMMSSMLTSCTKTKDPNAGKTDPGTIATSNLVAYFPFEGNATESIANLTPTLQPGVTYVTGRRGQAYQGASLAHLLYTLPAASKLKTLTSFSVAMWFKTPRVTGDPEPTIFEIGNSADLFWGNLKLSLIRRDAGVDTLVFKSYFRKTGVPFENQWIEYGNKLFPANIWMHLVFQYDQATSKFMIYKDGVKVVTNDGVEKRWADGDQIVPRPALGPLAFANADKLNIGAWRPKSEGTATDAWMGWFLGNLDELRVYDKALTAIEVKALYDAEVTQIE